MKKFSLGIPALLILCILSLSFLGCAKSLNYSGVNHQLSALSAVKNGEKDIAVVDKHVAGYYLSLKEWKTLAEISIEGLSFPEEKVSVAFRKTEGDTSMKDWFNYGLYLLQEEGKLVQLAKTFHLENFLISIPKTDKPLDPIPGTDFYENVLTDKTFLIGILDLAPYSIPSHTGGFNGYRGFDCEVARAIIDKLNEVLDLKESNKLRYMPKVLSLDKMQENLSEKLIDCIWNGFTVTEEREHIYSFSTPYIKTTQTLVVKTENVEKYTDLSSLKKANFVAEALSFGETSVKTVIEKTLFN